MKTLLLISILFSSGVAQAQSIAEAFKEGRIANLVWNKDFLEATEVSPNGMLFIKVYRDNGRSRHIMKKMAVIASHWAGKYLVVKVDVPAVTEQGSTLGNLCPQFYRNVDIFLHTNKKFISTENFNDATVEQIEETVVQYFESNPTATSDPKKKSNEPKKDLFRGIDFTEVFYVQTDAELDAILEDSKNVPVIVNFSGKEWDEQSNDFHPVLEKMAKRFGGKVRFVLVDIRKGKSSIPRSGRSYKHTVYVPELQVFTAGKTSGKQIQVLYNAKDMADFITELTKIKP